ncbi:class I SAM-dependent DNA methyltransferase [Frisingicoccus caecimuris]|uniref:site-specific DNA-methyltransferase (adenine-specific) n=1 Tax=Frisingicoccus caecimuris TaxID=1796636 RepID=A0A4R2L9U1_9FIRM|nr:DNA methyltransferase [Frisingicoccus caecimuris]MCR1919767.1 class I SAM-dependent DNA methyltransferase [Frisingicoccus caecimuris]TCO82949.1 type II restriction/modification system DNA methylase subunit YeeA [Frisingicoccus caecimuris]
MTDAQQRAAAKIFAKNWKDRGYEKGDSQIFWVELLTTVFGVTDISQFISFEDQVHLDHTSFIDGYIEKTHVMIEQKSINKSLTAAIKQSDGSMLTPFEQAKRYSSELPYSKRPRWIVTSNFKSFYIYDMEKPGGDPEIILLEELEKEYYRLQFLVEEGNTNLQREMEVSIAAGDIVGLLYDALAKQYVDPTTERAMKSLNILCVRFVFCLYAEDAGVFGRHGMFHDYLEEFDAKHMRKAVIELFQVLDTKPEDRDPYLEESLSAFPYVNGGLFANENIEIPQFTEEIRQLLLEKASADFNWSEISPTIFGAVFESTLNPETRRSGGMHYTSIENIHKVIDPLFLEDLNNELEEIRQIPVQRTKEKKLKEFQKKLAGLRWLDPASGSGNFLTETYISIRRLENVVIKELQGGQITFGFDGSSPIQVSIDQFYGIEINDFAVTVAKTALWIAESQMMKETEDIVHMNLDFLPLTTNAFIVEGNALQLDWENVVPKNQLSYIMGNPPFVGYSLQSKEQKNDILSIYVDEKGKPYKTAGKIDYVAGWYFKASKFMQGTAIRTAFVSTNSITQGEQVAGVWKPLYERFDIHIDFAHRTFRWDSEASLKAHVHCVIVGFSVANNQDKRKIYSNGRFKEVKNINAYLLEAPNEFISNRNKPLCDVPQMITGNRPADGGHLIIENEDYEEFLLKEPSARPYVKRLVGSTEFINNKKRWCLWLVGISPSELRKMPMVLQRVEACKEDREKSPDAGRRKLAETPTLFREINNPVSFILVPKVSSEKRRYVPMGFLDNNTISTDLNFIIPEATMYHFAILTSNIHMAWMRAVCGRMKSDYRYSANIVYNNFPWPTPTEEQKQKIEQTAQAILDARALYPDSSLADLYDELTMPPELRKAHHQNDIAVMQAYGFTKGSEAYKSEAACVAELMKRYQQLCTQQQNKKEQ